MALKSLSQNFLATEQSVDTVRIRPKQMVAEYWTLHVSGDLTKVTKVTVTIVSVRKFN